MRVIFSHIRILRSVQKWSFIWIFTTQEHLWFYSFALNIYETTSLNTQARCTTALSKYECIPLRSFRFNVFIHPPIWIYWINSKRCSVYNVQSKYYVLYIDSVYLQICWYIFWNAARDMHCTASLVEIYLKLLFCNLRDVPKKISFLNINKLFLSCLDFCSEVCLNFIRISMRNLFVSFWFRMWWWHS